MNDKAKTNPDVAAMFENWMTSTMNFWGNFLKARSDFAGGAGAKEKSGKTDKARKSWETGAKIMQSLVGAMTDPENMERLMKSADTVPEFMTTLSRQVWEGYFDMQKKWLEHLTSMGQQSNAYNFDDIDSETFQALRNMYEREFQKFFNVPSLGLTRFYQDKFNHLLDRQNLFHATLGEFLYMFYVPMEKAFGVMQEKMNEMAESGELHDNFKEYYNLYIKILEGHYMTLLKSSEYTEVMDRTIEAAVQYKAAREDFMCDMLKQLPIPTNREMDELYKEFYLLKKQMKTLSKQVADAIPPEKK